MRIAVIAAQGRSGRAVVTEALAAGHVVHAGIRGDNSFPDNPNLKVFQCDATDRTQVTRLIDRCDAVVSVLGHVKGSSDFVQTEATKTIVASMEVAGVSRFVSLTGTGVWVPGDRFERLLHGLNLVSSKLGVKRFDDGIAHVKVLQASSVEWTVVRVLLLNDGTPGRFTLKSHGLAKVPTPRREVARAILKVLRDHSFVREYPVVSQ